MRPPPTGYTPGGQAAGTLALFPSGPRLQPQAPLAGGAEQDRANRLPAKDEGSSYPLPEGQWRLLNGVLKFTFSPTPALLR